MFKNISSKIDRALSSTADSIQDGYQSAKSGVSDTATSISGGADNMVSNVVESASSAVTSVSDAVNSKKCAIEFEYDKKVMSLERKANVIKSTVSDVTCTLFGAAALLSNIGITVLAITAPVPTFVGCVLIYFIGNQSSKAVSNIGERAANRADAAQDKSRMEGAIKLLKKYGKIPEKATIRNEYVEMVIDSKNNHIEGLVLIGEYAGSSLSDLTDFEIGALINHCDDENTKLLIQNYVNARTATKANLG